MHVPANSRPSASNFKSFSRSLEQFFLTVGQNNFGNKIPIFFQFLFNYRRRNEEEEKWDFKDMQFLQKELQKSETFIMSAFVLSGLSETFCQSQEFAFLSYMQKRISNSTGKIIIKKQVWKPFNCYFHCWLPALSPVSSRNYPVFPQHFCSCFNSAAKAKLF